MSPSASKVSLSSSDTNPKPTTSSSSLVGPSAPTASTTTSSSPSFAFPSIYNFPPFFTKQPNQRTFDSQIRNWSKLVVEYCRFHRIWVINKNGKIISKGAVGESTSDNPNISSNNITHENLNIDQLATTDAQNNNTITSVDMNNDPSTTINDQSELFYNAKINRRLNSDFITEIFHHMISNYVADWYNEDVLNNYQRKSNLKNAVVIYWKTPEEWASLILQYVENTGNSGNILTLFELTSSELVSGQEFFGLHPFILHKALSVLVQQNRAQLMKDENGVVAGVKIV